VAGLTEWFWLDPAQHGRPLTVRRSAGSVWVELSATPQTMTITPGSGLPRVSCPGGGTPYSAGARPQTACTYTYTSSSARQPRGAYQVTATVMWGGTWRGSGGVGGALTPIPISDTFDLRIAEGQALNGGGR
jgi:hypothetical protein